jgi:hypothetical protein
MEKLRKMITTQKGKITRKFNGQGFRIIMKIQEDKSTKRN